MNRRALRRRYGLAAAGRAKKKRRPSDWPTVGGKPATLEQMREFVAKVREHYSQPTRHTAPHFCPKCTSPNEVWPCPVCRKGDLARAEKIENMAAQYERVE